MQNDKNSSVIQHFVDLKDDLRNSSENSLRSTLEQLLDNPNMRFEDKAPLIDIVLQGMRVLGDHMFIAGLAVGYQANTDGSDINTLVPSEAVTDDIRKQILQVIPGGLTQ